MEDEQIKKVANGLRCCVEAKRENKECPKDCPYQASCQDGRYNDKPLYMDLMQDALARIEEDYTTRLLPFDELMESKGMGWAEVWFLPDEEVAEHKELFEIVFIGPYYATGDGDHGCVSADTYNKPYHTRIWSGVDAPTDEQREAEAWS